MVVSGAGPGAAAVTGAAVVPSPRARMLATPVAMTPRRIVMLSSLQRCRHSNGTSADTEPPPPPRALRGRAATLERTSRDADPARRD